MCAGVWLLAALWLAASGAAAAPAVPEALPGAPPFPAALRERLASQLAQRPAGWEPRTRHRRPDGSPLYTNRLALEASPYLLQHAHNPVNWYAWGDEAFEVARELGRPVLVSIGYSTCHWCHVMEEQSFDDVETAELLNRFFVAVKVDRETRPDVDAIYMSALQAMGQRGGWPLNVWLTPDRQPFFGGTYFPPEDMPGRPGFRRVLRELHEVWSGDPARLERQALGLSRAIARQLEGAVVHSTQLPHESMLQGVVEAYAERFDPTWGGVRTHTKFPSALPVRLLLRIHRRGGDPRALSMTTLTLAQMAAGGLRDHLGGGFHRYTTEPRWLVPHFEKMLYDNALLAVAYLEGWQVTGREDFAEVARETLDYVAREMTDASGGFHSATDADSAGPDGELEEGRFFTWTPAELVGVLGADAPVVAEVYGVSNGGDLEGRSVLRRWEPLDAVAARHDLSAEELDEKIARARERLYRARAERPPPLLDDKIITSWNGLMISAFARAALAFDAPDYAETARRAADHLLASRRDGRLPRVTRQGQSSGPAFLEDYAFLIAGLLDLYEALPDPRWIREAQALQEKLDAHHGRPEAGAYYRSAGDGERLLAREKPARDGAVPSGNSVAAENLLRLAALTGEERYREQALGIFSDLHAPLSGDPAGVSELLIAVDHALDTGKEVLLVAPPGGDLSPLLDVLRRRFVPNRTLSAVNEGAQLEAHAAVVPLLRHKKARSGKVTAYVCENRVCRFPTSDPAELAKQLDVVKPLAPPPGPDA